MSKTLADLRAQQQARAERSQTVYTRPDLVAEVQSLSAEASSLELELQELAPADVDGDPTGPPQRAVPHPRVAEIRARLDEIKAKARVVRGEMVEHEGEIRWRAVDDGQWRRWVNDHPARDEGAPGYKRDQDVTRGYCNTDDLIDDLGRYAYSFNGEVLAEGDWEILAANLTGADKKEAATSVVSMHEAGVDFRLMRSGLSASLRMSNDSDSPETSASPPVSSTDESSPSSTSTSTPLGDQPA